MSKSSNTEVDKIAQRRQETEKRLEAMKGRGGKKKPLKTQGSKVGRILFPIIIVVLILAVIVWVAFAMGLPQKYTSPLSIGNEKISNLEYNYYFSNQMNQFTQAGIIKSNALGEPDLNGSAAMLGQNMTWGQYIKQNTEKNIQEIHIKASLAKAAGMELTDENKQVIDNVFKDLKTRHPSDTDAHNALIDEYGVGASEEGLRAIFTDMLLAEQYDKEHPKTFKFSESDVDKYYKEHSDDVDQVTYRSYMIQMDSDKNADGTKAQKTEEQKKADQTKAKEIANEILGKITNEDSFNQAIMLNVPDDKKAEYEKDPEKTLQTNIKGAIVNKEVADWLFDKNRQNGDKAVISSNDFEFVVYFISRHKDEMHLPTVRHILFAADRKTASPEEIEKAKKLAEDNLAKIKDEKDMEKLGQVLLTDGIAKESKLYEDVPYGQMVPEFNDWIFDKNRKPGDKAIVQTDYGFHIMYFVKFSDQPVWYTKCLSALQAEKYQKEIEDLKKDPAYKITEDSFGMNFVKYKVKGSAPEETTTAPAESSAPAGSEAAADATSSAGSEAPAESSAPAGSEAPAASTSPAATSAPAN